MERNDALSCLPFGAQIKGLRIGSSECWAPPPDRHRAHTVWNMVAQRYGARSEHPSSLPLNGTELQFYSGKLTLTKEDGQNLKLPSWNAGRSFSSPRTTRGLQRRHWMGKRQQPSEGTCHSRSSSLRLIQRAFPGDWSCDAHSKEPESPQ